MIKVNKKVESGCISQKLHKKSPLSCFCKQKTIQQMLTYYLGASDTINWKQHTFLYLLSSQPSNEF